jgi:hypothetical protein
MRAQWEQKHGRGNKRKKEKKSGDAMSVGREYHVFWTNGQWS